MIIHCQSSPQKREENEKRDHRQARIWIMKLGTAIPNSLAIRSLKYLITCFLLIDNYIHLFDFYMYLFLFCLIRLCSCWRLNNIRIKFAIFGHWSFVGDLEHINEQFNKWNRCSLMPPDWYQSNWKSFVFFFGNWLNLSILA